MVPHGHSGDFFLVMNGSVPPDRGTKLLVVKEGFLDEF